MPFWSGPWRLLSFLLSLSLVRQHECLSLLARPPMLQSLQSLQAVLAASDDNVGRPGRPDWTWCLQRNQNQRNWNVCLRLPCWIKSWMAVCAQALEDPLWCNSTLLPALYGANGKAQCLRKRGNQEPATSSGPFASTLSFGGILKSNTHFRDSIVSGDNYCRSPHSH